MARTFGFENYERVLGLLEAEVRFGFQTPKAVVERLGALGGVDLDAADWQFRRSRQISVKDGI